MRRMVVLVPLFVGVAMLAACASGMSPGFVRTDAASVVRPKVAITTFRSLVSGPTSVTAGPDGALWFTNRGNSTIGRISTSGRISIFKDTTIHSPFAITAGPDGALWFTNRDSIGRITTRGTVSVFKHPSISRPMGLTAGPDGALWFTNLNFAAIGRITTRGSVTSFRDCLAGHDRMDAQPCIRGGARQITVGPDGALWFTNHDSIGRIDTRGTITTFTNSQMDFPWGITAEPDGAVWFTNGGSIGRVTTRGTISIFKHPSLRYALGITVGPDGALWFTNEGSIGRITTRGTISIFKHPSIDNPLGITVGPGGVLWFANEFGNSIGRAQITPRH